jgi:hypothetical protein
MQIVIVEAMHRWSLGVELWKSSNDETIAMLHDRIGEKIGWIPTIPAFVLAAGAFR